MATPIYPQREKREKTAGSSVIPVTMQSFIGRLLFAILFISSALNKIQDGRSAGGAWDGCVALGIRTIFWRRVHFCASTRVVSASSFCFRSHSARF